MLPLNVPKERAAGRERRVAWVVYALLVFAFLAYGISLVSIGLGQRASGDVSTSIKMVEEQWQFPNLDICLPFAFPATTAIMTQNDNTDPCVDCKKEETRTQHPGFVVKPQGGDSDADSPKLNVSVVGSPVFNGEDANDICYRIHYDDFKATLNAQLKTTLFPGYNGQPQIWNGTHWNFVPDSLETNNITPQRLEMRLEQGLEYEIDTDVSAGSGFRAAFAHTVLPSGENSTVELIPMNSGSYLSISKHVRRKWNGKNVTTYPMTVTPFQYKGVEDYPNWVQIVFTAETESYELLHEIDPLDPLAIVGQLGGVFSFVALVFSLIFVRADRRADERHATSFLAGCLHPSADVPGDAAPVDAGDAGAKL